MRPVVTIAYASFLAAIGLAACVGDAPVGPSPSSSSGTSGDGGSGTSSSGSSGTSSGGTSGAPCAGDTIDACGAACTKCTAPAGGTVACTDGQCVPSCPESQTVCSDTCVDTKISGDHCGKCGRSCGGGGCTDGLCQPVEIAGGFQTIEDFDVSTAGVLMAVDETDLKRCDVPTGCSAATLKSVFSGGGSTQLKNVAVAGDEVFFSAFTGDPFPIYRCPVVGCAPGEPPMVHGPNGDDENNQTLGVLVAGPNVLYWARDNSYYGPFSRRCELPACTTTTVVRVLGTTQYHDLIDPKVNPSREQQRPTLVASAGAINVLWDTGGLYNASEKRLRSCALASPCTTPTEIDTSGAGVVALRYFDGHHYGISTSDSGSTIFRVADAANTTTSTALASDGPGASSVAVDASGIYWVNGTSGKVLRCPKLTGCNAGEIETLAVDQPGALRIRIDANNVYWQKETKILRVVKP